MNIPSEFKLFGNTIMVIENPELHEVTGAMGQADYLQDLIMLQPNTDSFSASKEQLEETFLHEMIHHILWKIERDDLSDDERFVGLFSKALHQAVNSFLY